MFDFLRRMIVPIMAIALVGFLATIIFQWGMDITSRQQYVSANTAAVINGEEISWREFNVVYDQMYQAEVQDLDEDIPEYRKKELRLAAWQQLLHDRLVMQEAAKREITVSDDELYFYLKYAPPPDIQAYFQTDGVFDYQKYMQAMANPEAAGFWAQVEPMVRADIVKQKLQGMIIQAAQVTEPELINAYLAANESVKIGMVNVSFGQFSDLPEATEEELLTYYNQHPDDYQVEERVVLNLVSITKEPQPYDWEVDSTSAMAVYDSLQAGADFVEMAQIYSEDITAQSGGDLGWFEQGQMVGSFDSTVFSMKVDEVSKPVKSEFGWHIIKVHEFRETTKETPGSSAKRKVKEAHASHILFRVTPSNETADRWYSRLRDFRTSALEIGFAEAAANAELEVLTTEPFADGSVIDHLGYDEAVSKFAFESELGAISTTMENRASVYVVQLAEKLPAGLAAFDEIKDQVKLDHQAAVVKTLCRDTANAIYTDIQQGDDLKSAARKHGIDYETPAEFTRNSYIRGLGLAAEPVGAAFSLRQPGDISAPIDYARGTVILELIEKKSADRAHFAAQRDSLYQVTLTAKHRNLYALWFDRMVENSQIINNVEESFASEE